MINLKDYKEKKQAQIQAEDQKKRLNLIYEDLVQIHIQLGNSINNIDKFKKYIPVQEALATLHTSLTIIEININKYKRLLNEK